MIVEFEAELVRWEARTELWTFLRLPLEESETIREVVAPYGTGRGFGAVRVRAAVGLSVWRTSIFPDGDRYTLPVKKSVRDAEGLALGDVVQVHLEVLDL